MNTGNSNEVNEIKYLSPVPLRIGRTEICSRGEQAREKFGLVNGFEQRAIVLDLGGKIVDVNPCHEEQTDPLTVNPDDSFMIGLSTLCLGLRRNFAIAREIGHVMLHWPNMKKSNPEYGMRITRQFDKKNNDLVQATQEANWFACAFLMPEQEFREAYSRGIASEKFAVADDEVEKWARSLNIPANDAPQFS